MHRRYDPILDHDVMGMTDNACIFVSKNGNDTIGDGSVVNPYLTLAAALAAVTATRKIIVIFPGSYVAAACLAWPTISNVRMIGLGGQWDVEISAPATVTTQVIEVAPGAQTATWEMGIENVRVNHDAAAGQDGIKITHTSVGKKLNVYLKNVGGDAYSDSDKFINVVHDTTGNAVRIYWDGDNGGVDGLVYFDTNDAGDKLIVKDCELLGGIETTAGAVASLIQLTRCVIKHAGITLGSATQVLKGFYCLSLTGSTYAVVDDDDVSGADWDQKINGS
jgi:hypothetical protein